MAEQAGESRMSLAAACVRAAATIVVAGILFVVVPDRLLGYLTLHIVPFWRDVLMIVYSVAAFLLACLVFVRLQGVRR
jgi:hypothetical protein